ncbi:MAG: hypothetical protein JNM62_05615 [Flavobacteriales bacterium]|nr:hypothetical protein [Flavobacteriales bacterium]
MAIVLDIDTFHKYLGFLATETTQLLRKGPDEDGLDRLNVELTTLLDRCANSSVPEDLIGRYSTVLAAYKKASSENVGASVVDGLITMITNFSFTYARQKKQIQVIQELKTDLEALAMYAKLHY